MLSQSLISPVDFGINSPILFIVKSSKDSHEYSLIVSSKQLQRKTQKSLRVFFSYLLRF